MMQKLEPKTTVESPLKLDMWAGHTVPFTKYILWRYTGASDEYDKPFCTKAIIDDFKNALGDTDNR